MSLQLKIRHKQLQVTKMKSNADRMPNSARLKFELKVSKTASKTEEFVTLAKETEDLVIAMREQLKLQIIKAAELEVLVFKRDLILDFLSSLRIIVAAYCHADATDEYIDATAMHCISIHHLLLLRDLPINRDEFEAKYIELHKVSEDSVSLASSMLSSISAPTPAATETTSPFFRQ